MITETLTTVEAARRARCSDRTMRAWLAAGLVDFVRDEKGKRRVVVASLDAHLAATGTTPAEPPATAAGLPEIAAELARTRKALEDAAWQVGYLTAQLEAERARVRLLEAGPLAVPEAAEDDPAGAAESPETPAPSRWERFRAWLAGG